DAVRVDTRQVGLDDVAVPVLVEVHGHLAQAPDRVQQLPGEAVEFTERIDTSGHRYSLISVREAVGSYRTSWTPVPSVSRRAGWQVVVLPDQQVTHGRALIAVGGLVDEVGDHPQQDAQDHQATGDLVDDRVALD